MPYKDTCQKMHDAGWLSHVLAATNKHAGNGSRHDVALRQTATYEHFDAGKAPPVFDLANSESAVLIYPHKGRTLRNDVRINRAQGLIQRKHETSGRFLVGFLSDVPRANIETLLSSAPN